MQNWGQIMQDEKAEKLAVCFSKVFPEMTLDEIPLAAQENISSWDSIAHVTLISLIGEEFATDLDFEEFDGATSFASILEILRARSASA
jgi:acyl carrier protein